jgi:hypothetical protein
VCLKSLSECSSVSCITKKNASHIQNYPCKYSLNWKPFRHKEMEFLPFLVVTTNVWHFKQNGKQCTRWWCHMHIRLIFNDIFCSLMESAFKRPCVDIILLFLYAALFYSTTFLHRYIVSVDNKFQKTYLVWKRGQSISTETVMQFTEEHVNKRFQAHMFLYCDRYQKVIRHKENIIVPTKKMDWKNECAVGCLL